MYFVPLFIYVPRIIDSVCIVIIIIITHTCVHIKIHICTCAICGTLELCTTHTYVEIATLDFFAIFICMLFMCEWECVCE